MEHKDDGQREGYRYEELFVRFSERAEYWLLRFVAVWFVLLIASQLLLQIPGVRYYFVKVEQLEGVPYQRSSDFDSGRPG
ncbi:DUF5359 family protein [Paenibacillus sp. TAB 01]|uniref:DUF5359 family protein n=1 Tax=Paenibacillus sp. TAB 01 TaxID=3368988 RepID=UPI0037508B1F